MDSRQGTAGPGAGHLIPSRRGKHVHSSYFYLFELGIKMKIKTVFVVAALSGLVRGDGGLKQFPCRGRAREMIYCSAFDTFR